MVLNECNAFLARSQGLVRGDPAGIIRVLGLPPGEPSGLCRVCDKPVTRVTSDSNL